MLIEPHVVASAGFVVEPTLALGEPPTDQARAAFLAQMAGIPTGDGNYADGITRWDWRVFHAMSQELALGDGAPETWMEALASLDIPKVLLWGARSEAAGQDVHGAALAAAGVPRRDIEGSAHFVPSEAPAALADTLWDIAAALDRRRASAGSTVARWQPA